MPKGYSDADDRRSRKPQANTRKGLLIGICAGGASLAIGAAVVIVVVNSGTGGGSNNPPDDPAKKDPGGIMTAKAFANEFEMAAAAASKKYQGKTVSITGEIGSLIFDNAATKVVLELECGQQAGSTYRGVHCVMLPDFRAKGMEISHEQQIKITGEFEKAEKPLIHLAKCSVEEIGKSPLVRTSALDLAKEFSADMEGTKKKYAGKDIIVSGPIDDLGMAKIKLDGEQALLYEDGVAHLAEIKLKALDKQPVYVYLFSPKDLTFLKKGQEVRMRSHLFHCYSQKKKDVHLGGALVVEFKPAARP